MDKKYNLTMNHTQLRVLNRALELLERVGIGHMEYILDEVDMMFPENIKDFEKRDVTRSTLRYLTGIVTGDANCTNIGIHNGHEDSKIACDIHQVVRKMIAEVENHEKHTTWRSPPMKYSKQDLPTIEELN